MSSFSPLESQSTAGLGVTLTVYDPSAGRLRDVPAINFNKAMGGEFSTIVPVRAFVNGTSKITNLRIAAVAASPQLPEGGGATNADGSMTSGNFGIEHGQQLVVKAGLSSFFPALNTSESPNSSANVSIGTLTENSSEYVYLNVHMPAGIADGFVRYKWFFDFS